MNIEVDQSELQQADFIILASAVLLTPVYYFSKRNEVAKGSSYILVMMTIVISCLAWLNHGVRDEVIFGFPAIIFFAAMMESRKLLVSLGLNQVDKLDKLNVVMVDEKMVIIQIH